MQGSFTVPHKRILPKRNTKLPLVSAPHAGENVRRGADISRLDACVLPLAWRTLDLMRSCLVASLLRQGPLDFAEFRVPLLHPTKVDRTNN